MESRPLHPGEPYWLGQYRLLEVLGQGSQGIVYRGVALSGEPVAVKVLHSHIAIDRESRRRFMREAEAARRVAAFCTVRVLDVGMEGDRPYIVSEYVEGTALDELVRRYGPRKGSGLDRLAVAMLTSLAAIHRAGIVHRDVKPSNVLMGPEGPVVIDFGIARSLDAGVTSLTRGAIGTPAYMSPEQISEGVVGPPSDIFSWASTMVYAATGSLAFPGPTVPAVINAIIHNEPVVSGVPEPLRSLILGCLAKRPEARPDAEQLLSALTVHAASRPTPSGPRHALSKPRHGGSGDEPPRGRRRRGPTRRRLLTWAGAGVGVAAGGGLVARMLLGGESAQAGEAPVKLEKADIKVMGFPFIDNVGVHIGIEHGVFRAVGLTVTAPLFASSEQAGAAFTSGALDVGFANYVTMLQRVDAGSDLKIISEGTVGRSGVQAVLVASDSPISRARDLEGRKVAVHLLKNVQPLMLNAVMRADGGDPAKIEYLAMPFQNMVTAVKSGKVDAAAFSEPFTTQALTAHGFRIVTDLATGPTEDWPTAGYYVKAEWLAKYPRTAAVFQQALSRAQGLAGERANVERVLQTLGKLDQKTTAAITMAEFPTSVSAARIQRVIDQMKEQGLLTRDLKAVDLTLPQRG